MLSRNALNWLVSARSGGVDEEAPRWLGDGMNARIEAWATEGDGGSKSDMPN